MVVVPPAPLGPRKSNTSVGYAGLLLHKLNPVGPSGLPNMAGSLLA
jgi:hypothetical protein